MYSVFTSTSEEESGEDSEAESSDEEGGGGGYNNPYLDSNSLTTEENMLEQFSNSCKALAKSTAADLENKVRMILRLFFLI